MGSFATSTGLRAYTNFRWGSHTYSFQNNFNSHLSFCLWFTFAKRIFDKNKFRRFGLQFSGYVFSNSCYFARVHEFSNFFPAPVFQRTKSFFRQIRLFSFLQFTNLFGKQTFNGNSSEFFTQVGIVKDVSFGKELTTFKRFLFFQLFNECFFGVINFLVIKNSNIRVCRRRNFFSVPVIETFERNKGRSFSQTFFFLSGFFELVIKKVNKLIKRFRFFFKGSSASTRFMRLYLKSISSIVSFFFFPIFSFFFRFNPFRALFFSMKAQAAVKRLKRNIYIPKLRKIKKSFIRKQHLYGGRRHQRGFSFKLKRKNSLLPLGKLNIPRFRIFKIFSKSVLGFFFF